MTATGATPRPPPRSPAICPGGVLDIAAALAGDGQPVALGEAVSGLDRKHLELVLAAIAHAAGSHEHSAP